MCIKTLANEERKGVSVIDQNEECHDSWLEGKKMRIRVQCVGDKHKEWWKEDRQVRKRHDQRSLLLHHFSFNSLTGIAFAWHVCCRHFLFCFFWSNQMESLCGKLTARVHTSSLMRKSEEIRMKRNDKVYVHQPPSKQVSVTITIEGKEEIKTEDECQAHMQTKTDVELLLSCRGHREERAQN